jgi:hypothetical protein
MDASSFALANRSDRVCFVCFIKIFARFFGERALLDFGFRACFCRRASRFDVLSTE